MEKHYQVTKVRNSISEFEKVMRERNNKGLKHTETKIIK